MMKAVIPPPIVFLICGALMWLFTRWAPALAFRFRYSDILFWLVLLVGFAVLTSGVANILRRKTVIHPGRSALPKATTLVTTGIFRYTRNPIYLGMAIMLLAWLLALENWLAVSGVVIFVVFITQYQIRPEEHALEKIFGEEYRIYKRNTGRWL